MNNATVNGDSMRLVQLFSNLLENSYRYTNDNGICRVTLLEETDYFIIHIDDSAPSVDEEELPLLFERFHRVDKSRHRQSGGAGLGLAICHNIVKAHNGYIYAQTCELGGVRIVVELPKF
jgi:two-component system sensor histidine kinase BaeS